jgi:type I restriction enzyme, S subunit
MSHIDDLINDLVPKGVPIQPLGQVGVFIRGRRFTKADQVDDGLLSIHYGEIYTHYGVAASETHSRVRAELAPTLRFAQPGDVIIAGVGETVEDVGKAVAWLGTEPVAVHDDCFIFRSSLDPKFVVYFMQSDAFNKPKEAHVARAKVKRLSSDGLAKLRIPVPPIEVQREIVRVLDLFSRLAADLTTQLDAEFKTRQRQYIHHRDSFLDFTGESVKWSPLEQVAKNLDSQRKPVTKSDRKAGRVPYYGASGVVDYVHDYIFDGDYLLVSEDGANLLARSTPIAFSISGKTWVNNHAHVLEFPTEPARRFVEIYLNSIDLAPYVTGSAQPKLNKANLNRIPVPVPAAEEQEHIVEILNAYEKLVTDLSSELSAELTARRKQYEYYRDRLLTFKELTA